MQFALGLNVSDGGLRKFNEDEALVEFKKLLKGNLLKKKLVSSVLYKNLFTPTFIFIKFFAQSP